MMGHREETVGVIFKYKNSKTKKYDIIITISIMINVCV